MPAVLVCQECKQEFSAKRSDTVWCKPCAVARRKTYMRNRQNRLKDACPDCGKPKGVQYARCRVCGNKNRRDYGGENNPNWRQGRAMSNGYVTVRVKSGSPGKGKGAYYRAEHIVVWERLHGQPLPKGWVVHHLNGVKTDNRPENLIAMPRHEHHSHPRKALHPYEDRIKLLEEYITGSGLPLPEGDLPELHEH